MSDYKLWYDNQKKACGELRHDSDRLFVQANGTPIHPVTISKWFRKFVTGIGLPVINFHAIRHTNATLLVSQNVDIAAISARLGHASITTTFKYYVHPLQKQAERAGYVLQNLLDTNQK